MGDRLAEEFAQAVHQSFEELRARCMEPNEAAAMAIRIGAGAASMPPALGELVAAIAASKDSVSGAGTGSQARAASRRLRKQVLSFFGSLDAVQAAFWPSAPAAVSVPAGGAAARGSDEEASLQLDMDAVHGAYSALTGLRDIHVTEALEEAAEGLVSELTAAHKNGGSSGAGFGGGGATPLNNSAAGGSFANGGGGGLYSSGSGDGVQGGQGAPAPGLCASPAALCRAAAVALVSPVLEDSGGHSALEALARAVRGWPEAQREVLLRLLRAWGARDMRRAVATCQQYITLTLYTQMSITPGVEAVTALLGLLHEACEESGAVPFAEFYNGAINAEDFNVQEDFRRWKSPQRYGFSFCQHPFVYDPASKARVLQLENQIAQFQQFESSMMQAMLGGASSPFLVLRVRRGPHLLRDTLLQINRAKDKADLRKPLKVQFVGEEGVDEGGVQKEFFQLLVRQAFNPEFGMFVYDEARRLHWFRASGLDMDMEYELIGILIGLAIYNSHILEFQFPVVLYKKLMGGSLGLDDLEELHPEVHQSLSKLLRMTPEEVDALGLTFEIESEVGFGELAAVELRPGGAATPVAAGNREEYALLYALHLLEGSVARQFGAFRRGFLRLCSGDALQLFRPAELEQLVCGGRTLDLSELEAATHYDDGYSSTTPVIRWFWEVAHSLEEAQRKRLLSFITGSDRVPIKGLAHLTPPFVISPNGGHSDRLPTAHTCFNHLLLPVYRDKETLRARLLLAIENAEGFGLM